MNLPPSLFVFLFIKVPNWKIDEYIFRHLPITKWMTSRFLAVFGDRTVKVFRLTGGVQSGNPEPLSHREFERRSAANGLVWKAHGDRSAVIDCDQFGAQIITTRLQLG